MTHRHPPRRSDIALGVLALAALGTLTFGAVTVGPQLVGTPYMPAPPTVPVAPTIDERPTPVPEVPPAPIVAPEPAQPAPAPTYTEPAYAELEELAPMVEPTFAPAEVYLAYCLPPDTAVYSDGSTSTWDDRCNLDLATPTTGTHYVEPYETSCSDAQWRRAMGAEADRICGSVWDGTY